MSGHPRIDAPKTNRDPAEIERKRSLLKEPHVAGLTAFVERLRASKPEAVIPDFDPTEAGAGARILLLLEAPGRRSARGQGSGFVSPDNDDQTAQNLWHLLRDGGIDRGRDVVTWNVVPWYMGDGTKISPGRFADLDEAREAMRELLAILPSIRVVVLLGRSAARTWRALDLDLDLDLDLIEAPHPSPLNLNTRPEQRDPLRKALSEALSQAQPGDAVLRKGLNEAWSRTHPDDVRDGDE